MSSIIIAGDTSGSVTLQAPSVAGSTILTLPSTSGTVQTSGGGYTTNGVAFASSTSVLATGSALTFDGTKLGVGTSSPNPTYKLTVSGAGSGTLGGLALIDTDAYSFSLYSASSALVFRDITNSAERMRLNSAGSLCVGSTSAGDAGTVTVSIGNPGTTAGGLQLWATSAQEHYIQWGDSATGSATYAGAISYAHATNFMRFWIDSVERMRIDSAGSLLVGATANSTYPSRIYALGTSAYGGLSVSAPGDGSGYPVFFVDSNATSATQQLVHFERGTTYVGSINTTNTATSYSTSSDYRLKNTIAPITGALAKVALLKPCTYKWNVDGSASEGFIAHELAEVCPIAVHGTKDAIDADGKPDYQSVDTSFLVATLTAAIQELKAEFDAYKASHP
jgi:hypothetical protein